MQGHVITACHYLQMLLSVAHLSVKVGKVNVKKCKRLVDYVKAKKTRVKECKTAFFTSQYP
jgi:hypothetical protein